MGLMKLDRLPKRWERYFMRKSLIFFALICQTAFAYPPLPEARDEQEALFVRRIIDFWRDKEYPFAKAQIQAFLVHYPGSPFIDHFFAMLGDMAMHEKNYREALYFYENVSNVQVSGYLKPKRWQALYQLQLYTQLYRELGAIPPEERGEEGTFYLAEAAFREGLALFPFPEGKQEALELFTQALPLYQGLKETEIFKPYVKLAMAEICRFLEKFQEAAALYLEIAEEREGNEEELFHAGAMLFQCDRQRALGVFENLARRGGNRAPEAAFQWMQLLAENEEWEAIAHLKDLWLCTIPEKELPTAYYYLGIAAFQQKEFNCAAENLQIALTKGIHPPAVLTALETLLASAKELNSPEICEWVYPLLVNRYPDKKAEASFVRSLIYQKSGSYQKAAALFQSLITEFPSHPLSEQAAVEIARIYLEEKKWAEARNEVAAFLKHYPFSTRKEEMLRFSIELSRLLIQAGEENGHAFLAEDLEKAFAAHIFEKEELNERQTLLAKAYLKLDRVHAALGILHEMANPDPLLFAHCYVKAGGPHEKIISYGEKALEKYPNQGRLHLHLFNAYLEQAKATQDQSLTLQAARHLDSVIDLYPVTLENRLWLAHHFVHEENPRALYLLESLFQTEDNWKRFDNEGILLARLYQRGGQPKKAIPLLQHLIALQTSTQQEAQLALGEVYLDLGKSEKAKSLFESLQDSMESSLAFASKLHLARLNFSENPAKSLKELQELKRRKTLATEPVHLEAALDFARLQASLRPPKESLESELASLLEMKEEFTHTRDIQSKDYHESRHLLPDKDLIYQAYMRYLDARICQLEAQTANDPQERKSKSRTARALFSTLRQGKYAVSTYLIEHAAAGLYE